MQPRGFRARALALACLVHCLGSPAASNDDLGTRLLRQPAISQDHLAFVYGGDIWVSERNGQHPTRLTTHPASESVPHFSPDGNWIAFSAGYDNNIDVYVIPVQGGQPRRLTWHPAPDIVSGWSADGKRILFVSNREVSNSRSGQFYEVPLEGGYERKVMQAVAVEGSWSPDGKRLAYRPYIQAYSAASGWRQHRGGDTPPLWILDPTSGALEKIPHGNASDKNPMWVGDDVAFISDRNDGAANLFLYDGHAHTVRQLTHETVWDIRNAGAHGHTIVFETGGLLKSLDLDNGQIQPLPVRLAAQAPQARPQWKDVVKTMTNWDLSLTGKRILITARGDVFSVPVKDGPVRNLTATSGVREADAYWSRDGQHVAYLSDAGGIQTLLVRDALGLQKPARHALTSTRDAVDANYFSVLGWAPDERHVVFQDNHLHLYAIDLRNDAVTLVDTSKRRGAFDPVFSPDGQWIAYTIVGENYFTQIRLYSFATGRATDLADRFIQTDNPVFGGDNLLYFTASIDSGPSRNGLDMSTQERPLRKALYAAVLASDGKSPLQPKSGDEELPPIASPAAARPHPADQTPPTLKSTRIDLEGLSQRFVPIPVTERNYDRVIVAADGALFYLARRQPGSVLEPPSPIRGADADLYRYDFEDRSEKLLRSAVFDLRASGDRKKLLIALGDNKLDSADANEKLDSKPIDLGGLRVLIDPLQVAPDL